MDGIRTNAAYSSPVVKEGPVVEYATVVLITTDIRVGTFGVVRASFVIGFPIAYFIVSTVNILPFPIRYIGMVWVRCIATIGRIRAKISGWVAILDLDVP